jgi:hypothetical protein
MRFVVIMMVARMADILCAAMLRKPLNAKDISGDFTDLKSSADDARFCTLLPDYCLISSGYNLPILTV